MLIGCVLVVCKIIRWDSDGTSEYKDCLAAGRRIVHTESVVGIGEFPFFSLYMFPCIANQVTTLEKASSCI